MKRAPAEEPTPLPRRGRIPPKERHTHPGTVWVVSLLQKVQVLRERNTVSHRALANYRDRIADRTAEVFRSGS